MALKLTRDCKTILYLNFNNFRVWKLKGSTWQKNWIICATCFTQNDIIFQIEILLHSNEKILLQENNHVWIGRPWSSTRGQRLGSVDRQGVLMHGGRWPCEPRELPLFLSSKDRSEPCRSSFQNNLLGNQFPIETFVYAIMIETNLVGHYSKLLFALCICLRLVHTSGIAIGLMVIPVMFMTFVT